MTMEPSKEYAKKHLELADEFLKDAKVLLSNESLRSAIDRNYYSMYYAVMALLISSGIRPPKTHKGTINLFSQEIINKDLLGKKYGIMLSKAFDSRQASTYEVYAKFGKSGVKELIENSDKFIARTKELIKN